jgi:hypothetical protein
MVGNGFALEPCGHKESLQLTTPCGIPSHNERDRLCDHIAGL